jgi:hypothetical protein
MSNTMASQLYQVSAQKIGGQVTKQPQQMLQQGSSEENMENAAMQNREKNSGEESGESKSIDTYA